jgi:two-component system NtrC family sensor kinase
MSSSSWCRRACGLVVGLLGLVSGPAAAQTAAQADARHRYWEAPPDSLRRVLATQHTDTARLHTLIHLVDVSPLWNEAKSKVEETTEAAVLSARLHRSGSRAYRLQAAGQQLRKINALGPALDSLQAAIVEFDRLHWPKPMLVYFIRYLFPPARQAAKRAYYQARLATCRQRGDAAGMAMCYSALGGYFNVAGDHNQAVGHFLQGAEMIRPYNREVYCNWLVAAGQAYGEWGNPEKALYYLRQSLAGRSSHQGPSPFYRHKLLAQVQVQLRDYPAAWRSLDQSIARAKGDQRALAPAYLLKSAILLAQGRPVEAGPLLRQAQHLDDSLHLPLYANLGPFELEATWAHYCEATGDAARAEAHWLAAYRQARLGHFTSQRLAYLRELTRFYQQQRRPAVAATYAEAALELTDTLTAAQGRLHVAQFEIEQAQQAQTLRIAGLRQAQALDAARARRQRWALGSVLAVLALLTGLGFLLWRSGRQKQLANEQLRQLNAAVTTQKHDLQTQRDQLDASLTDLRATQAQLIQKEKMASLGELTAGIAHEIQNPLNFVNNFAEVSTELLEELEEEQAKPSRDADLEAELVGDLRQNLGKISHHGRRAAAIVRGMLEHSRTSTGERAPTDLNQLAEEYLRLAYQGLRAKDKTFNTTLATDFAPDLPLVEAAGADLGRVLLNLFGNAFYAVQKRQQAGEAGYKSTVSVSTKQLDNQIEIRVSDNGTGIPDEVKAKIFQPFFTTKPTGEGTGLGLSLSYDIITKAHGGTLAVASEPGQGTEFLITLPA